MGSGGHLFDTRTFAAGAAYDLSVHGPNGFFRAYKGTMGGASLAAATLYERAPGVTLAIRNRGAGRARITIRDAYGRAPVQLALDPGQETSWHWDLDASFGWYDLTLGAEGDATFEQRVAGHVETVETA